MQSLPMKIIPLFKNTIETEPLWDSKINLKPIPHELWDDVVTRAGANLTIAWYNQLESIEIAAKL